MTCAEVESQLDLLAAGECDPLTRQAVERHLEHCAHCAASYAASQRMMGLLDLHWDPARQQRLHARIQAEEHWNQRRSNVLPLVRRFAAVAALILVTMAMSLLFPREQSGAAGPSLQLAARVVSGDGPVRGVLEAAPAGIKATEVHLSLDGRDGEAYRQQLLLAQSFGRPPLPPAVPLAFALKNTGNRPLQVRLGDRATELRLDVHGKSVVRLPAPAAPVPPFLQPRTVSLRPGASYLVHTNRLIAGARGRLEYIYLTEPGLYTLSARLRLTTGDAVATLTSETIRIQVER